MVEAETFQNLVLLPALVLTFLVEKTGFKISKKSVSYSFVLDVRN